jgi:hypothetical protein
VSHTALLSVTRRVGEVDVTLAKRPSLFVAGVVKAVGATKDYGGAIDDILMT